MIKNVIKKKDILIYIKITHFILCNPKNNGDQDQFNIKLVP